MSGSAKTGCCCEELPEGCPITCPECPETFLVELTGVSTDPEFGGTKCCTPPALPCDLTFVMEGFPSPDTCQWQGVAPCVEGTFASVFIFCQQDDFPLPRPFRWILRFQVGPNIPWELPLNELPECPFGDFTEVLCFHSEGLPCPWETVVVG